MVVTATSVTHKIANGVTARVVRDTVTLDGEIIEDTLDWYAQDADGTVWYLGEDTAEFEDGKITTREGSFEAGVDGAQAGVIMPASPEVGMAYRQEYYEGEAEDNGEVLALGQQASVPAGKYDELRADRRHHPARTRRAGAQVLRRGRRAGAHHRQGSRRPRELLTVSQSPTPKPTEPERYRSAGSYECNALAGSTSLTGGVLPSAAA